MNEYGILLHYTEQKISNEDNENIFQLIKQCAKEIDNNINNNGGIFGINLKTHVLKVKTAEIWLTSETQNVQNLVLPYLKSNNNIIALHGPYSLQDDIDRTKYIYMKTGRGPKEDLSKLKNTSTFFTSRVDEHSKFAFIKNIILERKDLKKIYFVNDGPKTSTRLQAKEIQLKKLKPKNFLSINYVKFKEQDDIQRELEKLYKKVTKDDIILLDVGLRVFKNIFDYYNKYPEKIGLIILSFGTLEGRFDKINFPLIESKNAQLIYTPIGLQNLYNKTNIKTTERLRELALSSVYRLDYPLLLKQAADMVLDKPKNRKELINALASSIRKINGKDETFVGVRHVLAFVKNNLNIVKDHFGYIFPKSLNVKGSFHKIFYHTQFFPNNNKVIQVNTNLIGIDIVRVTNVNIANGTWGCEFYLDVSSKQQDPIKIIIFNNLSIIDDKFEYKLIESIKDNESEILIQGIMLLQT